MRLAASALVLAVVTGGAPAEAAEDQALLERFRPVLRYDADERYFAQPVDLDAEVRDGDRVYGHVALQEGERWLQYWLFYAYNPQDRGLLKTGRHEGDWEFLQLRLGRDGLPDLATLAQHTWAEGCGWSELETVDTRDGEAPVVYIANGSHAIYSKAGTADRPWPDPNDEADGEGPTVRPRLTVIDDEHPAWVARQEPWGNSRAGIVPGEQSSPPGPRFQSGHAWSEPSSFHANRARPCGSDPPRRAWQTALTLGIIVALAVAAAAAVRRRRVS